MDILRMRECRQHCFQSPVAVLLPDLLHYSPSVEELYHQMRSSLYLFSLLFSLTHTALPHVTEITCTRITAKQFTECFRPRALRHFVFVDRTWNNNQWFPVTLILVCSLYTCRFASVHCTQIFSLNSMDSDLLILSSKKQINIASHRDFIILTL